jgi:hypothetical protein
MPYVDRDENQIIIARYAREQYPEQEFVEEAEQPFAEVDLRNYRDAAIDTNIVTHNSKSCRCDARSRESLNSSINYLMFLNDDQETINWKGPEAWYECTLSDLQGLLIAAGAYVQKAFDAEKTVLDNHASEAYTALQDALDDFDTEMEA